MFLVNVEKCLKIFDKVYVSSNNQSILDDAEKVGAIPILRGEELCGDVPNIPVYQHALGFMGDVDGIIAVQANSPTIKLSIIADVADILDTTMVDEVMTVQHKLLRPEDFNGKTHGDYELYGSVWAIRADKLRQYGDPYHPRPRVLVVDNSVDIHNQTDYLKAISLYDKNRK